MLGKTPGYYLGNWAVELKFTISGCCVSAHVSAAKKVQLKLGQCVVGTAGISATITDNQTTTLLLVVARTVGRRRLPSFIPASAFCTSLYNLAYVVHVFSNAKTSRCLSHFFLAIPIQQETTIYFYRCMYVKILPNWCTSKSNILSCLVFHCSS